MCEVARRGRFLVADPYLEPGAPISLGRRGSLPVDQGELVAVEVHASREGRRASRQAERHPRPDARRADRGRRGHGVPGGRPRRCARRGGRAGRARRWPRGSARAPTVTVDPPDARDFDDAISVVVDGESLIVYVHIADVAFHVRPGTALDREAARRALSVYVPGRVEPMLPPQLSNDVCSLKEGRDRRAVTVEVTFDAALRPGEPRFLRSLIRSDARLDYTEAHEILEGARSSRSASVVETLRLADRVSSELRRRRFARGALAIESLELVFELSDGRVTEARCDAEPRAHSLIEELMILANEQVAELLARRKLPALFRIHRAPEPTGDRVARQALRRSRRADRRRARAHVRRRRRCLGQRAGPAARSLSSRPRSDGRGALVAAPALARPGALLPGEPRPHGSCVEGVLPLHVADTALSGPRLSSQPAGGDRPAGGIAGGGQRACRACRAHVDGRAAGRRRRAEGRRDLRRELAGRRAARRSSARARGRDHGLIGPGLFVRFSDVFEGFLPSRRLDYGDRFEPNELGTALVGRANGRRFRLGDPLRIVVTEIDAPRGGSRSTWPGASRATTSDRDRGRAERRDRSAAGGRRRGGRADDGSTLSRWLRASIRLSPTAGRDTSTRCSSGSRPGSRSWAPRSSRCAPARR